jgi:hypothetical protein
MLLKLETDYARCAGYDSKGESLEVFQLIPLRSPPVTEKDHDKPEANSKLKHLKYNSTALPYTCRLDRWSVNQ